MPDLLNTLLGRLSPEKGGQLYPTDDALFVGLKAEQSSAIQCLYTKMAPYVFKMARSASLPDEETEELLGDAIALMLMKIRTEGYVFQGYNPTTYAIEIAKNKLHHRIRKHRQQMVIPISDQEERIADEDNEPTNWEAVQQLESLLNKLSKNCQSLIRLKYLEGKRDKELIEEKSTPYSTVDALKTHRAQCMKKLMEIAAPLTAKTSRYM